MCCQRFCCFQDETQEYNLVDKLPSLTQVACWRFLRARRLSTKFFTGEVTLHSMEKSKFNVCVGLLISFNYLVLYAVVIVPFVLIANKEDLETIVIDVEERLCLDVPEAC